MTEDHVYADEIAELKRDYPVGTVVEVETFDGEVFRARVTGHSEVVDDPDSHVTPANPGARLCVSTNPPNGGRVEDSGIDVSRAAMVPSERINGAVSE